MGWDARNTITNIILTVSSEPSQWVFLPVKTENSLLVTYKNEEIKYSTLTILTIVI